MKLEAIKDPETSNGHQERRAIELLKRTRVEDVAELKAVSSMNTEQLNKVEILFRNAP